MLLVCVLRFAHLFVIVVSANIATVLSISVAVSGTRIQLNCSIQENDSVQWIYTSWNTSTEARLYFGIDIVISMRSRYRIEKMITGEHNLIIDAVDLAHAGRYRCISAKQPLISDTQLTVLGSDPICASNKSETHVDGRRQTNLSIWCSINFTGNVSPVFSWSKNNGTDYIDAQAVTSDRDGVPLTITSSITEYLYANDNGVTYQCQITFQMPNNSQGNGYEYMWTYTLYGPRNLSIVRQEDRLVCSADGNPTPIYRWTIVETNISVEESVYILNLTKDQELVLDCNATNIFATEKINYTIKGTGRPTAKDSGGAQGASDFPVTALAIGASLVFLLIIAAIVVSCVVRRSRLKDDASDRPDVALNTDSSPYDEVVFSSDRTSNYILEEYRLPGRSDGFTITDNDVYSEVSKPKGRPNGKSGGDPGEKSRPIQTQTRAKKNFIGADGTEYAELSGVKPPDRQGEIHRPPAFNRVDVYAFIDHNGRAPPPPPKF